MRSHLPDFQLVTAQSLDHALLLLAQAQQSGTSLQPLAGGTDLMVLLAAGKLPPGRYLNLWGLPELRTTALTAEHLDLGALTTYADVRKHPLIAQEFPSLVQAARETGAEAIQQRGTLGGNLGNASPAADSPPALLTYDAQIQLASVAGRRWVPYASYHTGYKQTVRRPDELITLIRLPRLAAHPSALHHYYRKVGTRRAQAISKVCLAARAEWQHGTLQNVRIAVGSVAPTPLRCTRTEACLTAAPLSVPLLFSAQRALAEDICPIDDIRSTADYRRQVTQNLLSDWLRPLLAHR